jgi:hypothetical protein
MDPRKMAVVLGAVRVAIGTGLAAAPGLATRGWIGPHAENGGARLMARAAGGRDIGIGAGILASLPRRARGRRQRQATRIWLDAAAFADGVDLLATVAARRSLPPSSLVLASSLAGTSALAHLWLREQLG